MPEEIGPEQKQSIDRFISEVQQEQETKDGSVQAVSKRSLRATPESFALKLQPSPQITAEEDLETATEAPQILRQPTFSSEAYLLKPTLSLPDEQQ